MIERRRNDCVCELYLDAIFFSCLLHVFVVAVRRIYLGELSWRFVFVYFLSMAHAQHKQKHIHLK